ncbi:Cro/Cl family transcriptional regulator [Enterococcus songbeiensis]|uniref:Cro/Cl family transcriptional regulator n=1 Tax=Enterococcus songbeiensis TaxID=2559927 RepID=UPI001FE40428|nr:Cro/Cl family transcriptional regulator [Enterococcus songbeiensis]
MITTNILEYMDASGEFDYSDKETLKKLVKEDVAKFDFFTDRIFDGHYLVGKLINTLANDQETSQLINTLSQELTNKSFTGMFGGEELIRVIQILCPVLIKLYSEVFVDELADWFEE